MIETALITGASGGIGLELARIHAEKGRDMILVARSEDKLNELKQELEAKHQTQVYVIAEDLSDPLSADLIAETVKDLGLEIDILINNAGFGGHGLFHKRELSADRDDASEHDYNHKPYPSFSARYGRT